MMGRWRVERSRDGRAWEEIAAFFGSGIALGIFHLELQMARYDFIRLLAPDGTVQERARPKACQI